MAWNKHEEVVGLALVPELHAQAATRQRQLQPLAADDTCATMR